MHLLLKIVIEGSDHELGIGEPEARRSAAGYLRQLADRIQYGNDPAVRAHIRDDETDQLVGTMVLEISEGRR